jgi:hypothetical protein
VAFKVSPRTEAAQCFAGKAWLKGLHDKEPDMVPHELPDQQQVDDMIADLPMRLVSYTEEADFYCVVLQVLPGYMLQNGPLHMQVRSEASTSLCTLPAF